MRFADLAFARRLEMTHAWRSVNYAWAQEKLRPELDCSVEEVAGGYAIYAGEGSPLNRAVGVGLRGTVDEEDVEFIEEFFWSAELPPRIDVCPLSDFSLLGLLQERGYQTEGFYSVLALDLEEAEFPSVQWREKGKGRKQHSDEVAVSIATGRQAKQWLRTVAEGFTEEYPPPNEEIVDLAPNFYSDNATCFFAWLDGEPAGGGAMYEFDGAVELGGASTRPAFRRRGVQTALLRARLITAQELGCDLAMSITQPGSASQHNMERVGFQLAYTKIIMIRP